MHDVYLTGIPAKPIDSASLLVLRKAIAYLIGGDQERVSREEAWRHIERVAQYGYAHLGRFDEKRVAVLLDQLNGTGYLIDIDFEVPTQDSEAPQAPQDPQDPQDPEKTPEGPEYDEAVARIALVLMRQHKGDIMGALNEVAMLAHATGEKPGAPSLFMDAGILICEAFKMSDQVEIMSAIGEAANVFEVGG